MNYHNAGLLHVTSANPIIKEVFRGLNVQSLKLDLEGPQCLDLTKHYMVTWSRWSPNNYKTVHTTVKIIHSRRLAKYKLKWEEYN